MGIQDRQARRALLLLQLELYAEIQREEKKMTVTTCDRCGKVIQGHEIMRIDTAVGGSSALGKSADLCRDCMNKLWRWINEPGTADQKTSRNGI